MNLLNNACKFTKEGGTVSFKGGNMAVDRAHNTSVAKFIIEDNGCGMSEAFLTKIFTPFTQERTDANMDVQGTGLGLAVSYAIVQAMGGEIAVESKLGKGSVFTVSFPMKFRIVDEEKETEKVKEKTDVLMDLTGKRILLAEDHPLNAVIAMKLLEKTGIIVTHANNGEEAVKLFHRSKPGTFDAILMDVRMPKMDGLTATRAIRALDQADAKTIPIIAMTANAYDEDRQSSLDAGMKAHLAKPVNPDLLYKTLRKYLVRQ